MVRGRTSQFTTCLTLVHTSLDLGAKIHQWNNPGQPETQWRIRVVPSSQFDTPGATYAIQNNKARGKFLNVYGASYDNGGKIIVRGANSRMQNACTMTHARSRLYIASSGTTLRCLKRNGTSRALVAASTTSSTRKAKDVLTLPVLDITMVRAHAVRCWHCFAASRSTF